MLALRSAIREFLDRTGVAANAFGRKAVNDPNLIRDILNEDGRRQKVRAATERKIYAFMEAYERDPSIAPSHRTEPVQVARNVSTLLDRLIAVPFVAASSDEQQVIDMAVDELRRAQGAVAQLRPFLQDAH